MMLMPFDRYVDLNTSEQSGRLHYSLRAFVLGRFGLCS